MDNDDYCDDASNAKIERKKKMWLNCSEKDRCIECERSRKQGALEELEKFNSLCQSVDLYGSFIPKKIIDFINNEFERLKKVGCE